MNGFKSRQNQALVVSTDHLRCAILEFELSKAGFLVKLALDAKEAFHLAEKQHFDLVFTDFKTPNGTGVDLIKRLRQLDQYDATPMVLLADEKAKLDSESLRDYWWVLVIREPYNIAEMVEKISRHLVPHHASL